MMVLFHGPLFKKESMEWWKCDGPRPKKAKVVQITKKMMVTMFWDCDGILLISSTERNTTVNSTY